MFTCLCKATCRRLRTHFEQAFALGVYPRTRPDIVPQSISCSCCHCSSGPVPPRGVLVAARISGEQRRIANSKAAASGKRDVTIILVKWRQARGLLLRDLLRGFLRDSRRGVLRDLLRDLPRDLVSDLLGDLLKDLFRDLLRDLVRDLLRDLLRDLFRDLLRDLLRDLRGDDRSP